MKKLTREEFIKKAKEIHGNKYDYSKSEYADTHTKVSIICPIHGEFLQSPHEHYKGNGCKKCLAEKRKLSHKEFVEKAEKIHGKKYDYSKVEYSNNNSKVCIICPIHGEFWQTPYIHIAKKCGCPECGKIKSHKPRMTTEEFIKKAKKVHGDKYNYSKTEFEKMHKKICIICPIHGEFWQKAGMHLNGCGCQKCFDENVRGKTRQHNNNWFIEKAKEIHGNKYDYSKVEYKTLFTKVCIICPTHGEFWQTPASHIYVKNGCQKCSPTHKFTTEEFIEKAKKVHGNRYDYSKVEYINNKTKVCIICPTHGEFYQIPNTHLMGNGCKKCKISHLENEIRLFLEENEIRYEEQKTFEWLKYKKLQYLDFYLPDYNIAIECQGEQHFQKSGWGKGDIGKSAIKRDLNKQKLCDEHNIKIFYYSNLNINYPYKVYEDKNIMLEEIKNTKND